MKKAKQRRKRSSIRHTRAIQQNRSKHPVGMPPAEEIEERIRDVVHPATLAASTLFSPAWLARAYIGLA